MDVSSRNHKKTSVQLILSWSMHAASRMRKYWVVTVMFIICCDKWADKMIICLKAMCLYSCKMLNKAKYGNWQHLITLKISASSAIHPRLANMSTFYITHNTPTEQTIYFHHWISSLWWKCLHLHYIWVYTVALLSSWKSARLYKMDSSRTFKDDKLFEDKKLLLYLIDFTSYFVLSMKMYYTMLKMSSFLNS